MIAGVGHVESAARGLARERPRRGAPRAGRAGAPGARHLRRHAAALRGERGGRPRARPARRPRRPPARAPRAAHGLEHAAATRPSALLAGLDGEDVYFAHCYAAVPSRRDRSSAATVEHDGPVVAAVEARAARRRPVPPRAQRRGRRAPPRERAGMVKKRVIPCLDVAGGRVVKGVHFEDLRDMGDPVELATRYSELGADELVFLDITATLEGRGPMLELVERAAEELSIPFTVGGGVTGLEDARALLRAGADKVAVNRAAFDDPRSSPGSPTSSAPGGRLRDRRARRRGRHARRPHAARARRGRLGAGGGRARRRRDPAHVDRRRRHARRLRPRADAGGRRRGRGARDRLGRRGRAPPPRRGVRGGRRGGARRVDRARAARAAARAEARAGGGGMAVRT